MGNGIAAQIKFDKLPHDVQDKSPQEIAAFEKARAAAREAYPNASDIRLDALAMRMTGIDSSTDAMPGTFRNGDPNNIIDPKNPGLYVVEQRQGEWVVVSKTNSVTTDHAAINGMLNFEASSLIRATEK